MLTIAYSGKSKPSAILIAEASEDEDVVLHRRSSVPVDINWGRNRANSELNPDISNTTNKREMRELFASHDVPIPLLMTEEEVFAEIQHNPDEEHHYIGRPDKHSKSRGLWHIKSLRDLSRAVAGTRKKKAATHFMPFIEHEREYRVHIFKEKSIRISRKEFEDGNNKYTTAKPGDIKLKRVRRAAKKAVAALGIDFGAVDILARGDNNDEVFVLEVNAAPGLGGSMPQLYAKTFDKWKRGEF